MCTKLGCRITQISNSTHYNHTSVSVFFLNIFLVDFRFKGSKTEQKRWSERKFNFRLKAVSLSHIQFRFTPKINNFRLFSGSNNKESQTQCLRNPTFSSFSLSSLLSTLLSNHSQWLPTFGLSEKSNSIAFKQTENQHFCYFRGQITRHHKRSA